MRNLETLSAERILSIRQPEELFSHSEVEAKDEYRLLARLWHPDQADSSHSTQVFVHIAQLYKLARQKMHDGTWVESCEKIEEKVTGLKRFVVKGGGVRTFQYLVAHPFELGWMYIGEQCVAFEVEAQFEDLFFNGLKYIRKLGFLDRDMAVEMSQYLPQIVEILKTDTGRVLMLRKTPEYILLSDVLAHYGGSLKPYEHAGWILNVLSNIACYLEWAGLTHNSISLSTVFVSPRRHSGMLLGGWWYACPVGSRLLALPDRSLALAQPEIIDCLLADSRLDLDSIRALGRELLSADVDASAAADAPDVPTDLLQWLRLPSCGSALNDYAELKYEILPLCFGPPRFVNLQLESKDVYKEI